MLLNFLANVLKNALKSASNFNYMFDALDMKILIVEKGHFSVFYWFKIFGYLISFIAAEAQLNVCKIAIFVQFQIKSSVTNLKYTY